MNSLLLILLTNALFFYHQVSGRGVTAIKIQITLKNAYFPLLLLDLIFNHNRYIGYDRRLHLLICSAKNRLHRKINFLTESITTVFEAQASYAHLSETALTHRRSFYAYVSMWFFILLATCRVRNKPSEKQPVIRSYIGGTKTPRNLVPVRTGTGGRTGTGWAWCLGVFVVIFSFVTSSISAQTMPKDELIFLTSEWKGERFADRRPKIADNLLERAKVIGIDDAWTVLKNLGYLNQFEEGWKTVNDLTITGRAVTAMYMPSRPDVLKNIMERGAKQGRSGATNSWPIDGLTKGDLYVADSYGKIADGPIMGSTLGNSIYAKSGNGVVINGAARDLMGLLDIKGFNAFVREWHPSFVTEMVLMGLNTPIRIGSAMVLPGDLVIGNKMGILFVPAHLAEQVVTTAEFVNKLDMFKFEVVKAGTFTTGQIDNEWPDALKVAFLAWLDRHPELGRMTRAELDNMMKSRTW